MEEIARMWKSFWMLFTSNRVSVLVGDPIYRFDSYEEWSDKKYPMRRDSYICLDAHGRVCSYGKHFRRAQQDDCYPVIAYEVL